MFNFINKKKNKEHNSKREILEIRLAKNEAAVDELKLCLNEMTSAGINTRSKAYKIIVSHIDTLILEQADISTEIANLQ